MINFLYTNIGRGHPFYLDGVLKQLKENGYDKISVADVFEISIGRSLTFWKLARRLYKIGSTDSFIGHLYNRLRDKSEYNKESLAMRLMGRDIKKHFQSDNAPLVVAHPVLVGILNGKKNLLYQHGEPAVPKQAVVRGAEFVFVPLEQCLSPFLSAGYDKAQLIVTGLCVEPALLKISESAYEKRLKRIQGDGPLTGAFFSSGAEPKPHVEKIVAAVSTLSKSDQRALVFAQSEGSLQKKIAKIALQSKNVELFTFTTRNELDSLTAEQFERFDYFVAPSHERTNWALGLGLPMFILEPAIGPFAPINRTILLDSEVAISLDNRSAYEFPWALDYWREQGRLFEMAKKGRNRFAISGFETIAEFLANKYPPNP